MKKLFKHLVLAVLLVAGGLTTEAAKPKPQTESVKPSRWIHARVIPLPKEDTEISAIREVPGDGFFPDGTFVLVNETKIAPGLTYTLQFRLPGEDWIETDAFFQSGPGWYAYGITVIGAEWRLVRWSAP